MTRAKRRTRGLIALAASVAIAALIHYGIASPYPDLKTAYLISGGGPGRAPRPPGRPDPAACAPRQSKPSGLDRADRRVCGETGARDPASWRRPDLCHLGLETSLGGALAQPLSGPPESRAQIFSVRSSSETHASDIHTRPLNRRRVAVCSGAAFVSSAGATSMRTLRPTPIEAQPLKRTRGAWPDRAWTVPSHAGLPDLWLMIEGLGALKGARRRRDLCEFGPDGST